MLTTERNYPKFWSFIFPIWRLVKKFLQGMAKVFHAGQLSKMGYNVCWSLHAFTPAVKTAKACYDGETPKSCTLSISPVYPGLRCCSSCLQWRSYLYAHAQNDKNEILTYTRFQYQLLTNMTIWLECLRWLNSWISFKECKTRLCVSCHDLTRQVGL